MFILENADKQKFKCLQFFFGYIPRNCFRSKEYIFLRVFGVGIAKLLSGNNALLVAIWIDDMNFWINYMAFWEMKNSTYLKNVLYGET